MKKTILLAAICAICTQAHSQWSLTGNAGTNSSTNFIGTTDNANFKIRTKNNVRITVTAAGKVGIGTTAPTFKLDVKAGGINTDSAYFIDGNRVLWTDNNVNTFVGINSGTAITTGGGNTGCGVASLSSVTTGLSNIGVGYFALSGTTVGSYNTAMGRSAMAVNTTASQNTAIGFYALSGQSYLNGGVEWNSDNVAVGFRSLSTNISTAISNGVRNTAIGSQSLFSNSTGFENTASGFQALYNNTLGNFNTAAGTASLYSNTLGSWNTAFGETALYNNTTAGANVAIGGSALLLQSYTNANTPWDSYNTAVGYQALFSNQPTANVNGVRNTAVGFSALRSNTTGYANTSLGDSSAFFNTIGRQVTAIGAGALRANTTGISNTAVGYHAFYTGNFSESSALGYNTEITANFQVRLGSTSVTSIGGFAGWSNVSDGRYKKNVQENVKGLDLINKLRPVTYMLDVTGINRFLQIPESGYDKNAAAAKEKIIYSGFIAQEVEKAAHEIGYDFSAVDAPKNENDLYALRYADFVVPLVKAVQELDKKNEDLSNLNAELIKRIEALEQKNSNQNKTATEQTGSGIGQNQPNPVAGETIIPYTLPTKFSSAAIQVTDGEGHIVKVQTISQPGNGTFIIHAGELAAGNYQYTLIIDGKNTGSRQMIIAK
ncbi:MAG: tail fiber domain-containing protein [Bacteroidia bacterium]